MLKTDIKVLDAQLEFEYLKNRTPLKFGAVIVEGCTYCTAKVKVENGRGQIATGTGGGAVADAWSYPSKRYGHAERDPMLRAAAELYRDKLAAHVGFAHPIDTIMELEPELKGIGAEIERRFALVEAFPFLAVLVAMAPLDAALHDAFGLVNGIDTYAGYGSEHMADDLSRHLGPGFKGKYPGDYLHPRFKPKMPLFHLVGALDKLTSAELDAEDPQDGLPVSLDQWIAKEGLHCLKVKLVGNDVAWDVQRILDVDAVAREVLGQSRSAEIAYSVDTNEQCGSPEYCVEMLERVRNARPEAFDAILYVEQPTERDLGHSRHDMRKLGAMKPVIIDESLTEQSAFDLAVELGWSGVAMKSGKGHTASLMFLARASELGMPYAVQDLTLPRFAYLHSLGFAARIDTMMGVEGNGRQYFPLASGVERTLHAEAFDPVRGEVSTASMRGPGLGLRLAEIEKLRSGQKPPPISV